MLSQNKGGVVYERSRDLIVKLFERSRDLRVKGSEKIGETDSKCYSDIWIQTNKSTLLILEPLSKLKTEQHWVLNNLPLYDLCNNFLSWHNRNCLPVWPHNDDSWSSVHDNDGVQQEWCQSWSDLHTHDSCLHKINWQFITRKNLFNITH